MTSPQPSSAGFPPCETLCLDTRSGHYIGNVLLSIDKPWKAEVQTEAPVVGHQRCFGVASLHGAAGVVKARTQHLAKVSRIVILPRVAALSRLEGEAASVNLSLELQIFKISS